jgi:hypothetical protein
MTNQYPFEENLDAAESPESAIFSKQQRDMTLEELLEGIPEGTCLGEYDWGPPRGAEIWWELEDEQAEPERRSEC